MWGFPILAAAAFMRALCYDIPQHEVIHTLVPEAPMCEGAPTGKIPGEGYAKPRVYLAPPLYSRMHLLPVLNHENVYKLSNEEILRFSRNSL
jgi:hypothetical protein